MRYADLNHFLNDGLTQLVKGPIAVILVEDDVEVGTTIRHHREVGFRNIIVLMHNALPLDPELEQGVARVSYDLFAPAAVTRAINGLIELTHGRWLYYCYNAEYLFFPFCETRGVVEMLTFHAEERRAAMLTYVVDLYADDLTAFGNAVSLDQAHLDRAGYYALARTAEDGRPKERQLDFYGGLRWRFEEHVPYERRKIDRIGLFKSKPGLELQPNNTFNDEEYNTFACPWHHNLTAAICSFRAAKALRSNPGSRRAIDTFRWHNSAPFEWHSRQLLDLGLMEPGQWF
ncbi:MAG: hypothetical protein AAFV87_16705 [Pseudomonadota bacterium]